MIRNTQEITNRWYETERARRAVAEEGTVQSLTIPEIKNILQAHRWSAEDLRAELKRRKERLRYSKIMANPFRRAQLRARRSSQES